MSHKLKRTVAAVIVAGIAICACANVPLVWDGKWMHAVSLEQAGSVAVSGTSTETHVRVAVQRMLRDADYAIRILRAVEARGGDAGEDARRALAHLNALAKVNK